ncbi:MAG TPA: hypothetical protein VN626_10765, partial [Clostridia bacterium]|nr:hypothetical protein [Clostridia bacterium]
MKKPASRMLSLMLVIASIFGIFAVQSSALTPEEIIVFKTAYTKDEKFIMPVNIGLGGRVSATLTDSNNNVIENFTTMLVEAGTTMTYKRSFSSVKSGVYYLNVEYVYAADYGMGEKSISRRLKITHNGPGAKLTFSETYQSYTDAGDLKQVLKLNYSNAKGKKVNFEVYDEYGNFINKSSLVLNYVSGTCHYNWNYYPSKGGLRASNGIYILKYWIQGQTPK